MKTYTSTVFMQDGTKKTRKLKTEKAITLQDLENKMKCPTHKCYKCGSDDWDWANIGFTDAKQCTNCGEIFFTGEAGKPWVEITKGQIDDCLKHSDNYDFAWAIEASCKKNNGY